MKKMFETTLYTNHNHGYSLAELIVAAAIVALTVLVLVGVVRKGNEISVLTQHRQRARAIIDSCFESTRYRHDNYVNIAGSGPFSVLIDPRVQSSTGDDLIGTLSITVVTDTNRTPLIGIAEVEYKKVTMSVSWPEPKGTQTIALERLITKLD